MTCARAARSRARAPACVEKPRFDALARDADVVHAVVAGLALDHEIAADPARANDREETLEDRIGARMRSRLYEMCRNVKITGSDYRRSTGRDNSVKQASGR